MSIRSRNLAKMPRKADRFSKRFSSGKIIYLSLLLEISKNLKCRVDFRIPLLPCKKFDK